VKKRDSTERSGTEIGREGGREGGRQSEKIFHYRIVSLYAKLEWNGTERNAMK
jgi:hypothetical protein